MGEEFAGGDVRREGRVCLFVFEEGAEEVDEEELEEHAAVP